MAQVSLRGRIFVATLFLLMPKFCFASAAGAIANSGGDVGMYGDWGSSGDSIFSGLAGWEATTTSLFQSDSLLWQPPFTSKIEFDLMYGIQGGFTLLNNLGLISLRTINQYWEGSQSEAVGLNMSVLPTPETSAIDLSSVNGQCTLTGNTFAGLDHIPLIAGTMAKSLIDHEAEVRGVELARISVNAIDDLLTNGVSSPWTAAQNIADGAIDRDRTWYQGYFKGIYNEYVDQGVDPFKQGLPVGPFQAWSMATGNPTYTLAQKNLDIEFMNGGKNINIILPYSRPLDYYRDVGLSNWNMIGLMSSPIVIADKETLTRAFLTESYGPSTIGFRIANGGTAGFWSEANNVIAMQPEGEFSESLPAHEGNHAGVDFLQRFTRSDLIKLNLSPSQIEAGVKAIQSASILSTNDGIILRELGQTHIDVSKNRIYSDLEIAAYLSQGDDSQFIMHLSSNFELTTDEAKDFILATRNSVAYKDLVGSIDGFYNGLSSKQMIELLSSQHQGVLK